MKISNPSSPDEAHSLPGRLLYWMIYGCVWLFAITFLGLVGALLLGTFEHGIHRCSWVGGALLAAVGYPGHGSP